MDKLEVAFLPGGGSEEVKRVAAVRETKA